MTFSPVQRRDHSFDGSVDSISFDLLLKSKILLLQYLWTVMDIYNTGVWEFLIILSLEIKIEVQ